MRIEKEFFFIQIFLFLFDIKLINREETQQEKKGQ